MTALTRTQVEALLAECRSDVKHLTNKRSEDVLRALLAAWVERDAALAREAKLREALERARSYIERDEAAHGRSFGEGNVVRAALGETP